VVLAASTGPDLSGRSFNRILIVKPSSLGDVLHALPVLHGLRRRFPEARIDWLVAPPFAAILEDVEGLDEAVLFDRQRYSRVGRSPRVTQSFGEFLSDLRGRRYDLVIDLQGLLRTGFMAWASGARVRIGFAGAREGAWMFYTHRMRIADEDAHAVDRNYAVAELLGFEDVEIEIAISLPGALTEEAARLVDPNGARGACGGGASRIVAVVPGARWETKRWGAEKFSQTIDALQEAAEVRCVLLGSADEVDLCGRIARACKNAPVDLAGRTSVRLLAAAIGLADAVLCHDSAAMHLAVALGRPLVCLVGPTSPGRTGPYGRPDDVVRLDLECAPCYLRRLSQCRHEHKCMEGLGVDVVVEAVERSLGAVTGSRA